MCIVHVYAPKIIGFRYKRRVLLHVEMIYLLDDPQTGPLLSRPQQFGHEDDAVFLEFHINILRFLSGREILHNAHARNIETTKRLRLQQHALSPPVEL